MGDPFPGDVSNDMTSDGILQPQGNFAKGSAHPRLSECDSRQPFTQGQNHTNRMVSSSQDFSDDLPNLAQTNGRYVCNQNEQQTTSLCISSPRSKCNGSRCIEYLVGGTRRLCLSNISHTKVDSKDENLCLSNDCSSPRVARDDLVLGPNRTFHKTSATTSTLGNSAQTASQRFHQNPQYLNLHVWHLDSRPKFLKNSQSVAERIKAPQRFSSRRVYESRWTIFESWCKENQVDFHQPSLSSIADFLTYLFTEKNLNPTTIAGYRTAIADHVGSDFDISKNLELNRLLASFHRDRPVKDKAVSNWGLSLVLLALTKPPFEPLRKASLKFMHGHSGH